MEENGDGFADAGACLNALGSCLVEERIRAMTKPRKIAFIKARWHADVVDQAYDAFLAAMAGTDVVAFDVPGAFEMPLLAKKLGASGDYDAVVAAALVVDGRIYRHDFVAAAVVNGLMQAQMDTGVPVFSVSLTPHHYQETAEHVAFYKAHFVKKGAEAAGAVKMVLGM
jgi:6,7-dimethyl-8-ribityllumazine synthase